MAQYSWSDLQRAADEAGFTTWVITADGMWSRQPDEALDGWNMETTLHAHLTAKYDVVRRRGVVINGKPVMNVPWVWVRRQGTVTQYVVLLWVSDTSQHVTEHAELIIVDGLPSYLTLLKQLREAGLIS